MPHSSKTQSRSEDAGQDKRSDQQQDRAKSLSPHASDRMTLATTKTMMDGNNNKVSSASSSKATWAARDAAQASRDGAFITAWPAEETYAAAPSLSR